MGVGKLAPIKFGAMTLSINDTQHNDTQHKWHSTLQCSAILLNVTKLELHFIHSYAQCHYTECLYAELRCAEHHGTLKSTREY